MANFTEIIKLCQISKSEEESQVSRSTLSEEEAFENGTASTYPKPEDMKTLIENQLYNYEYENVVSIPP